jgi:hypothetical protein
MSLDEQVAAFLSQHRGRWYCDKCLAIALDLPTWRPSQYVTDNLATGTAYSRQQTDCDECKRTKLVTMAN